MAGKDVTTIEKMLLLHDDRHRGELGSFAPLLRRIGLSVGWGQRNQGADKGRVMVVSSTSEVEGIGAGLESLAPSVKIPFRSFREEVSGWS